MIREQHKKRELSIGTIWLDIYPVGDDVLAVIQGGDRPHIGCTVLSVPRESLNGNGSVSCTSSVINITGHKDEYICRLVSEALATHLGVKAVCTGGFHKDDISEDGIREVTDAVAWFIESLR